MDDFSQTLMRNRKSASGPLFLVCLRYRDLHIHSVLSGRHRQLYTEYLQDLRIQKRLSLESIVCCPAHTGS